MSQEKEAQNLTAQVKALNLELTTMKGMAQADAPRLEARLRSIEEALLNLQTGVASLEAANLSPR
ncbi:hypothetical protein [Pseudomonas serboccidentalis]|uniref:hypothetical protein n=1 Tax=Pseudomonas serboccidentalis TaxID=2964670 RepID=UPI0039E16357